MVAHVSDASRDLDIKELDDPAPISAVRVDPPDRLTALGSHSDGELVAVAAYLDAQGGDGAVKLCRPAQYVKDLVTARQQLPGQPLMLRNQLRDPLSEGEWRVAPLSRLDPDGRSRAGSGDAVETRIKRGGSGGQLVARRGKTLIGARKAIPMSTNP
jgi:hypothetical protein